MKKLIISLSSLLVLFGCAQQGAESVKLSAIPSVQEEDHALSAIKNFSKIELLEKRYKNVKFLKNENNPNTNQLARKFDADGHIYLLNQNQQVTYFNDSTAITTENTPKAKDLEKLAKKFTEEASQLNLEKLTPSRSEKAGNSSFRWEDTTKPKLSTGKSPFVEVTLRPDGLVVGYINALI